MARVSLARLRRPLLTVGGLLVMALLLAWLMGAFRRGVAPGDGQPVLRAAGDAPRVTVAAVQVPAVEAAVGTVRAIHETAVASRILGRIRAMRVERAGQRVARDDVLVELDAEDLRASLDQAGAALVAAETARDKAEIDLGRSRELVAQGVAAPGRLDADAAAARAAAAEAERARQVVAAAESALAYATIRAPIDGIVVDKKVNPGDVVQPGQLLFTLYDPSRLQLVAVVREELAGRLQVGQAVDVTLDALGERCQGTVAEIVPEAQARSRSFEVKVVGPCHPGVVTGMFGRLHIPLGERTAIRVPATALERVGQLDFVHAVAADGTVQRRYVRTGRTADGSVEVLAGLVAGEVILATPAVTEAR